MGLLAEYHEELELDLLKQGIDLLDFYRGTLSARRLDLIIRHLPPDSLTVRKAQPDAAERAAWTPTTYAMAALFDAYAKVNFKDPVPFPRPGDADTHEARVVRLVEWRKLREEAKRAQAAISSA